MVEYCAVMKIRGVYILTLRSIKRMIAAIAAAFLSVCTSASTPEGIVEASRLSNAVQSLMALECTALTSATERIMVSEIVYLECKALYLNSKKNTSPCTINMHRTAPTANMERMKSLVTKADLRSAVKTILRGEDVNLSKPGPRLTAAKRRQIAAAENYRKTHCGCTLHNACLRSFTVLPGGYASGKSLYLAMHRERTSV